MLYTMHCIQVDYIKYNHKDRYFITIRQSLRLPKHYVKRVQQQGLMFKTFPTSQFYKAYLHGFVKFIRPKKRILVEHTSANLDPEGLHLGNLSTGIIGNYITNFMKFIGFETISTYWVNNCGTRILRMAETLHAFPDTPIEQLYQKYLSLEQKPEPITKELYEELGNRLSLYNLKTILQNMQEVGITYDRCDYESDYINKTTIEPLKGQGYSQYFKLRDKNKYIMTTQGTPLYLKSDINYTILEKLKPQYNEVYTVVGKDHQLYFSELTEILHEYGYNTSKLKWIYVPLIKLNGEKMSKTKKNIIKVKDILKIKKQLKSNLILDVLKLKILSTLINKKENVTSLYEFFETNIDLWFIKYYLKNYTTKPIELQAELTDYQIEYISEILHIKINYINYTHFYTQLNHVIKKGIKFFRSYFIKEQEKNYNDYLMYILYKEVYHDIIQMVLNNNVSN